MMEVCPQVDFYISSTVGLINALTHTDFHRSWVEQGLIKPQDFNFNLTTTSDLAEDGHVTTGIQATSKRKVRGSHQNG
jgi:hypothetical protein